MSDSSPYRIEPSLRRLFAEGFSVRDIAEPLVSFDASTCAEEVGRVLAERQFDVAGVRRRGLVTGFVRREELAQGCCGDFEHALEEAILVPDSEPLGKVIPKLNEHASLFVTTLGPAEGIVTRSDLQKPAVRMWLFGMITLIEMRFTRLIERFCPGESWLEWVSEGRRQKAEELLAERQRCNQSLGLLECLQFGDKGQIIARCELLRTKTQFASRRRLEEVIKRVERLRNSLAHAQDLLASDWESIVQLSEHLDQVLAGPPGLREPEA